MKKTKNYIKCAGLSFATAIILSGCGGGGSSTSTDTSTGTLIDNVVSGVKYVNGTNEGFTDANGKFPYTSGLVEFYLGGIKIGELNDMTSDNNVFIQDILGLDRSNTTDTSLLKVATLLQTLDSDPTTDEIEIDSTDFAKFDSISDSLDTVNVSTILANNGFTAKTEEEVKAHIENSLKEYGEINDIDAPTLVSSSITNGQTGVATSASIVLTFSEDIPKKYLTTQYFKLIDYPDGNSIDISITSEGNIVTITPVNGFTYSQSLEFTISSELKDFAGNKLINNGGNTDILIEFLVEDEVDTTAPTITTNSVVTVDENQTSAFTIGATDNSSTLTYSLSGTDESSFNINSLTGVITFKVAPDYETKNLYSIIVGVKDGSNNSSSKEVTININDVYEADTTYPVFTSNSSISVDENQTSALTLSATDNSTISYSLSGTDATNFNIDVTTGVITFKIAPNYETKNSYSIIANATDSSNNTTTQNITISINDVYENTAPIANAGVDKTIYYTESVTLDASNSSDNSGISAYEWSENSTVISDQISFVKSDFTVGAHTITLKVTDDEGLSNTDTVVINVFNSFTDILPMDEVGGVKSISSFSNGSTTTVTLGSGSQLYFKITNDMNREFTVNSFNITSYYNGIPTVRVSSTDLSLLSGGTLTNGENISLGYTLTSNQTANYWIGTYNLTDVNTGETFTNSFTWNGTSF